MSTARLDHRVVLSLWRLLLAGLLLAALLPSAGVLADDPPAPADLPADVWASVVQQLKQLTAADGGAEDDFGVSVAIAGDTVVVGAPDHDVGTEEEQGAAYIFGRNQGGAGQWGLVKQLLAADGDDYDLFGFSVGISGDIIVVGAFVDEVGIQDGQGSAYVYQRDQGGANNWGQVKQLIASDGEGGDEFGTGVAIDGDTIVVGSPLDNVGGNDDQGSAYVFSRHQGGADNWGQVKQLLAGDGEAYDEFGRRVAISGNTIVVGADEDSVGGNYGQGSAYVFYRDQGGADNWGQVKQLTADDGEAGDQFGSAVGISGDTIVVGAEEDSVGSNDEQGSAYIFYRNQGGADNWGQVKQLLPSDGEDSDEFGSSVGVSGDAIVVGAEEDDVGSNEGQGSAYLFGRNQAALTSGGRSRSSPPVTAWTMPNSDARSPSAAGPS